MTFPLEDLRHEIVELFDEAQVGYYLADYHELPSRVGRQRTRRTKLPSPSAVTQITSQSVERVRALRRARKKRAKEVARAFRAAQRQAQSAWAPTPLPPIVRAVSTWPHFQCPLCRSQAPAHRCPVQRSA